MRVVEGCAALEAPPAGAVVTIGNFDGVHIGHQAIVAELVARARSLGGTACLLTFDPPPSRVLGRKVPVAQITTLEDRAWLLERAGLDLLVVEPFTLELAAFPPERFVEEILHGCFRPAEVRVGYDFAFGRDRRGDVEFLRAWFAAHGTAVHRHEAVESGGIVSSTRIREHVLGGDVAGAARLLGRPHFVRGRVVEGDRRGRLLGFPTANLSPRTELLPADGVYATWTSVGGRALPSVTNVGRRPTFGGGAVRVESHVLDFSGDLYGRDAAVFFAERLRGEQAFASFDALKVQILADAQAARALHAARVAPPEVEASTARA